MKNKKKIFENILLGILTFFLICYISVGILFITGLNVSKNYINKDKISNIVSNIDISDIFEKVSSDNLNQLDFIKKELMDIGLSETSFNEFINSNDVQKFGEELITNVLENILNDNNIDYKIDENKVRELLQNNIPELQINDELVTEVESKINEKIESKLPILVDKMNSLIDNLIEKLENSDEFIKYKDYLNKSLGIFDIIYSNVVNVILVTIIMSFIVLLIYIRKNIYKSLKWISISLLIPGLLLNLISLIKNRLINIESSIIDNVINSIINDLKTYGLIYLVVTLMLIVVNIMIYIIKHKKSKEVDGVLYEEK